MQGSPLPPASLAQLVATRAHPPHVPPQEWDDPVAAELQALAGGASGSGACGAVAPGGGRSGVEALWTCAMGVTEHGYRGELEVEVTMQVRPSCGAHESKACLRKSL